jgi:phenylacetate-CoA ligase
MSSMKERVYDISPVWVQNLLVSAYGYHLYRKRYQGIFHDILALLKQSRNWNRHEVEAWQAEHLHNMVRNCRQNVPYYQKLFSDHGLHEQDFTSAQDVRKLPILQKQTLRKDTTLFRSTSESTYMLQHTSGSTGTPLALEVDEYTYKLAMALLVDHEEAHGVPLGAPRATFAGRMVQPANRLSPPFARYNRAENQMLFSSYHLNSDTFQWYAKELKRFRPWEIIGYPSAISDLASHYLNTGTDPGFRPKAVITNSETLLEWQKENIEQAFHCAVFDYYGTAEYVLFAGQEADGRYRLNPVIGITEVLNDSGEPASEGRLVATTLTNRVMPLLRYEIGDSGIAVSERTNQSVTHELEKVNGRLDDYVEMPDGRRIGRLDHIFKGLNGLVEAQIIQDAKEHCTIQVVFTSPPSDAQIQSLSKNFKIRTASQISVDIHAVKQIARGPNGKFRNVVREFKTGGEK